jgi:hypothetical protein
MAGWVVPQLALHWTLTLPPPEVLPLIVIETLTVCVLPFELKVSVPVLVPLGRPVGLTETDRLVLVVPELGEMLSQLWLEVTVKVVEELAETLSVCELGMEPLLELKLSVPLGENISVPPPPEPPLLTTSTTG